VVRRGSVTTSVGGEAAPGREKGGGDISWVDTNFIGQKIKKNFIGQKIKKIHMIDSAGRNGW
jgi:hypothetical protein